MRRALIFLIIPAVLLAAVIPGQTIAGTITLLHTNDLHSHFMPFAPELDYIPDRTPADDTVGGFARIAAVLRAERESRTNPVFTVDAGDFTMGTLFHMLAREESFELTLMHDMGYDYVTLGNHEFDMFPDGLARIITTAHEKGKLPDIVFSSAVFSDESDADNTLKQVFDDGLVRPYAITEADGLRVGFFGLMGEIAAGDAPFASPVTFRDPVETARDMVDILRNEHNADIVVCLSHSGVDIAGTTEDPDIARAVDGIDVIISGHSHTTTPEPLIVNNTVIVQAGNYGQAVGVLDLLHEDGKTNVIHYDLVTIDDTIPPNPATQAQINGFIAAIDEQVLKAHDLSYWKVIGRTPFDLPVENRESTGGNFMADAIRWYVDKHDYDPDAPETRIQMAIKANGVIRSGILAGNTGRLAVTDLFRALPLGIGMDEDNSPGYPLVTCYIHGYEIKRALEVITSVYPLRGSAYFLQLSGVRFTYNPHRILFDRVTNIEILDENGQYQPLDYSRSNQQLYRVAANIYEATFLQVIGDFTFNILEIVPKDRHGNPIDSLVDFRVDADPETTGITELKEWLALMEYVAHFDDITGDGLADIPERYRHTEGRITEHASLNPVNLLSRGTWVTWTAFAAFVLIAALVLITLRIIIKRIRR